MKKIILFLLIAIIFAASYLVAANGRKTFNSESYNKKELVFWTLQLGTFSEYIQPIIDEYEKEHKDVKITWIDIPYSEGGKRTLAAIMSDNPPDLINATPDFTTLLAQKNTLLTLKKDDVEQFLPSVIQGLTFDGGNSYYALPFYATTAVTIYNKALLEKMGISKVPVSYDEMYALSELALNRANAYITMPTINENDTFLKILNKYDLAKENKINSKEAVGLVENYKTLYDKDYIPKESLTQTHRESLEKYMSGQLVFYNGGGNFLNLIKENAPDVYDNTDVALQITGPNRKYDYSLMTLIIPKNAKNAEGALSFAKFLTNEKNQLEFAKLTTVLPVNRSTIENDYFKNTDDSSELQHKARIISAAQLKETLSPIDFYDMKNLAAMTNKTIAEIILGKTDSTEGLNQLNNWWKNHK